LPPNKEDMGVKIKLIIPTIPNLETEIKPLREHLKKNPLTLYTKLFINDGAINAQLAALKKKISEIGNIAAQIDIKGLNIGTNSELITNQINRLEKTITEYGELIKKIEHLDANKNRTKLEQTYRNASGVETTVTTNNKGEDTAYKQVTNIEKLTKAELKSQSEIQNALAATESKRRILIERSAKAQADVINRNKEQEYKAEQDKITYRNNAYRWITQLDKAKEERDLARRNKEIEAEKKRADAYVAVWQKAYLNQQQKADAILNKLSERSKSTGVKFGNLSPDSAGLLEHQLTRYQSIIKAFQQKNEAGIFVSDKELRRIENLGNQIDRLYAKTKIAQKDSQGFSFTKYEKFTDKISPQISNITDKQQLYNKSLLETYKLIDRNIQETDKYIKVDQRLRRGSEIRELGVYIDKSTGQVYKFRDSVRDLMTRSWDLGSSFKTAFEKIGLWAGATSLFYGVARAVRSVWTEIVEVDKKLTELSKVLSNDTNWDVLFKDTAVSANYYAKSITQALDAEIEFAKQGYEQAEAVELSRAALLGANVTGMQTAEVAERLTGALAQFNIEAKNSVDIINKVNEVDNNFAVTSQGLMQAIQKSGEAAQQFGLDLDTLLGYVTAVSTGTRESGNIVGGCFLAA
jgi:hypothetical protein